MSSTEEDSEMSYDSSCSGDSFINAIEEENGVSRMVIMGLPAQLSACFSQNESFALTGMSLRVHPFLYEMSGAPCKFSFCAGFSSYHLEDLRKSLNKAVCFVF